MKRIDVANLLASAANIAVFSDKLLEATRELGGHEVKEIASNDKMIRTFISSLTEIAVVANWLELRATMDASERCKSLIERLVGSGRLLISRQIGGDIASVCHQIITSLSAELKRHHTYVVAPQEAQFIDDAVSHFGLQVVEAFPQTRADISAGATCRAYELWTASVMHMMRVAEVGVGVFADHLGVKRGTTWGGTIANVIDSLKDMSKIKGDPDVRQWASETGTYLNFVKDAFRNPAMHPERTFSREEAISIYDNTRSFMRMLARRLSVPAN